MPTIFRTGGFEFMIYTHDHAPAHVHAWHSGNTVIIQIEGSPAVRDIDGMRTRDIATAKAIVRKI